MFRLSPVFRLIFVLTMLALYGLAVLWLGQDPLWRPLVPAIVMSSVVLALTLTLIFSSIRARR